jgi:hypothetical protein
MERRLGRQLDVARLTVDHCSFDLSERDPRQLAVDLLRVLANLSAASQERARLQAQS